MPTAYPLPSLRRGDLVLRPAERADADALLEMLAEPAVAEWWGDNTLESVIEEMAGAFTIEIDGEVAGLLECHEEPDETYPSVAFDIFLGTRFHGRAHGRRALRMAIDHFANHGHHRFTIDPTVGNEPAIRAYAAVGFKPVGTLRAAERSPAGEWRDALLMDLLAWELDPVAE
ncbi:MAG: GNAT family protein [Solirubrobacteraceae bacterium]|nr:GNAT family protein [Solirubrobacteraceae bacterium]